MKVLKSQVMRVGRGNLAIATAALKIGDGKTAAAALAAHAANRQATARRKAKK